MVSNMGKTMLRHAPPKTWRRPVVALLVSALALPGGAAHGETLSNRPALNCKMSNWAGGPWRDVQPLTSASQKGEILMERGAALYNEFDLGGVTSLRDQHELVAAAKWRFSTGFVDGSIAPTNVAGIGLQVSVMGKDGQERVLKVGDSRPVVLDKAAVTYESTAWPPLKGTTVTNYIQRLILTESPANLPTGELKVTGVIPGITLTLYATDFLKDAIGYGESIVSFPSWAIPNVCGSTGVSYQGTGIVNLGGGGGVIVPNKCEVGTYRTIPVQLGEWPTSAFATPGATSSEKEFSIVLSNCSAKARPRIRFTDKNGHNADPTVLNIESGPGKAKGIGIIMTNALTNTRITYDGVTSYDLARTGVADATIPLRASYIRTSSSAVEGGEANGSAEFIFEFP